MMINIPNINIIRKEYNCHNCIIRRMLNVIEERDRLGFNNVIFPNSFFHEWNISGSHEINWTETHLKKITNDFVSSEFILMINQSSIEISWSR